jgi:peptide/nickel transport system substrate-binding protein
MISIAVDGDVRRERQGHLMGTERAGSRWGSVTVQRGTWIILLLVGTFLTVGVACGGESQEPAPGAAAATTPAASVGSSTAAPVDLPRSARPLRVATNVFPAALDPDVGFASFSLMGVGIGEALMRVTPEMEIVPWLAESIEQLAPDRWQVTIRDDATFHDGTKVDALAVQRSFERTLEKIPGPVAFALPEGTQFEADGQRLVIVTPGPSGSMPSNLAIFYLIVKKELPDGTLSFTGPYMPAEFVEQQSLTLAAYEGHRDGPARTPSVELTRMTDVNARVLAVQAGDADLAFAVLPNHAPQLEAAGLSVESFLFGRLNGIIVNNTRPGLDDPSVRQALSLAVDRSLLVDSVLEGYGLAAFGIATTEWGIADAIDTQRFDREEAVRLLDDAGWLPGADGVRMKDGQRLSFALGYYTSRPELEPFAVVVQDQWRQVGVEVTLEEYPNINQTVAESTFDATLYSYNVAPSGDLNRGISQLFVPGASNRDRYSNEEVNRLFDEYNQTADPAQRSQLVRRIQELIGEDVPFIYLAFPQQIVALSPKVEGYVPHPLENYQITASLYVAD